MVTRRIVVLIAALCFIGGFTVSGGWAALSGNPGTHGSVRIPTSVSYMDCHTSVAWYYSHADTNGVAQYPVNALHGLNWCFRALGESETYRLMH